MSRIDDLLASGPVEFRNLGSVCRVFSGYAFPSAAFNTTGVGLPLVRVRDVNSGLSGTYYSGSFDRSYIVRDGEILIAMDGDFGVVEWSDGEALLNQRVCRLQEISPDVLPRFLRYQVQREVARIHRDTQASTVKHLSAKDLATSRIPVPPLEVQHEIVRVLDAFADLQSELAASLEEEGLSLRARHEYARDTLLDFPRGVVRWVRMREVGAFFGGLTGKTKGDFVDGNARFVSYVNVLNNIAVDTSRDDFVRVTANERQRSLARGDVILTGSSETQIDVGMSSVVTASVNEPLYLNSFSIGYRLSDPDLLDPAFSKHLFRSTQLRKQIRATASGVTRFNVSKGRLGEVEFPVPPIDEQRRIADVLDTLDAEVTELTANLTAELAARRTQYEYYRDKLLTFREAPA